MWCVGKELVLRKSRFVGRVMKVTSLKEAGEAMKALKASKAVAKSTHNISACRVGSGANLLEEANDNGEPPAARRLLQLMRRDSISDCLLVVTRWYGGVKVGPDRFRVIDACARDAIDRWKS